MALVTGLVRVGTVRFVVAEQQSKREWVGKANIKTGLVKEGEEKKSGG
jgi:hypothetical protein